MSISLYGLTIGTFTQIVDASVLTRSSRYYRLLRK